MRIFLTGATGYVGSAVCDALVRAGHEVTALVRNPAKARRLSTQGVQLLAADLGDPAAYRDRIAGFDGYVHTALDASARAADVDRKAIETIRDIAWRSSRAVFIYTSGIWVLGSAREPVDETAPTDPSPTAPFRAAHEQLVLDANGGGLRAIVVRPGMLYGGSQGFISDLLRDADNGIVRVIGNGDNHWALVYDRDLADLFVKLIVHPEASGIFHATDEGDESVNDLVRAMSRHVEFKPEVRYMPLPEARAKFGALADALALDQMVRSPRAHGIGWTPTLKSVGRNVPRLFEEWRNGRAGARGA
jgi:nucleoside-diphosphate-sugar epimerase